MTRLTFASEETLSELESALSVPERILGFRPNALRVMAHKPEIMDRFLSLVGSVLNPNGDVPISLKHLVAYAASLAAGCSYCQAHTAGAGGRTGVPVEKLAEAWNYEKSDLFSHEERVAMRFAQKAASQPNALEAEDFSDMRSVFSEAQVVEILSVVCLFGFLNRWNDSLATRLETEAEEFGTQVLKTGGWDGSKHGVSAND